MTVRELIERLSEYPHQDHRVVVRGYESGFDEAAIGTTAMVADANWDGERKPRWFDGRHGYVWEEGGDPGEPVVVIDRQ